MGIAVDMTDGPDDLARSAHHRASEGREIVTACEAAVRKDPAKRLSAGEKESPLQVLLHRDIWPSAKRFKGRGQTMAAIAYVNADHLGLRAGDTLICDASRERIETAATSALVLAGLHKKGVRLFHLPGLHAKIVLLPRGVLIGSANMTENSLKLSEAAVLSDDGELISQVEAYFRGLLEHARLEKIDRPFLARILALKVIVRGGTGGGRAAQRRRLDSDEARPRLWIAASSPLSERTILRTVAAIGAVANEDLSDADFMQWGIKDKRASLVRRNDFMICVDRDTRRAGRPARVAGVFESEEAKLLVHKFADDSPAGSVSWERLGKVLRDAGLFTHPTGIPNLLLVDPETEARVRTLYRPVR